MSKLRIWFPLVHSQWRDVLFHRIQPTEFQAQGTGYMNVKHRALSDCQSVGSGSACTNRTNAWVCICLDEHKIKYWKHRSKTPTATYIHKQRKSPSSGP